MHSCVHTDTTTGYIPCLLFSSFRDKKAVYFHGGSGESKI